jgi:adenylosuccinate lyase
LKKTESSKDSSSTSEKAVQFSELFSPTDFRYGVNELKPFLSEESYVKYKARVEAALASQLAKEGICSRVVANEIAKASESVTAKEVYEEEARIKHDIRALANCIRNKVSEQAKPYVHLGATSYDIVDTANALRIKHAVLRVIVPDLLKLERALIEIALKYSNTAQIGRTHGQHAEPVTFGYYVSFYVSRLGKRILEINERANKLTGKFAGAVGVYGPLSLMVKNPERFELELLASLGLAPSEVSTQIVQPEPITDLAHSIVSTFGVLANFARDMRHLQRTEISEVGEEFSDTQVGSSTMPQKRNPINFENVESMWKKFMPQMVTVYMDQISEHQRDLTNSSSQRYLPELLVAFDHSVRRLTRTIWNESLRRPRLWVDETMLNRNLEISLDSVSAEPIYVLLALAGHPDAHESVRRIVQKSIDAEKGFREIIKSDPELARYSSKIPRTKWKVIENPRLYIGIAPKKARSVAMSWKKAISKIPSA